MKNNKILSFGMIVKITDISDNSSITYDNVHLWTINAAACSGQIRVLSEILSDFEKKRAERFFYEQDTQRYIVAHGVLRHIISKYSRQQPENIVFNYNPYGKPSIKGNLGLRFNMSHSGDTVFFGITKDRDIGVDVERIRPFGYESEVVLSSFSTYEKNEFMKLPESSRIRAFFSIWTLKEAYIKALGIGMSLPLDTFSVAMPFAGKSRIIECGMNPNTAQDWSVEMIPIHEDYAWAIAVEGRGYRIRKFVWT